MKKYDKPDHCPICFEILEDNDYLECGHWTHIKCIEKTNIAKCAICRISLKNIKISKKISQSTTFQEDINSLLDISDESEDSNESDESIEFLGPQIYTPIDSNQSNEKKLIIDTINHLKHCDKHNYGGYYIDEDIEFFENILENGDYNFDSYLNLKRICDSAINRAYTNYFCQGPSNEDSSDDSDNEDYPEEESNDEEE